MSTWTEQLEAYRQDPRSTEELIALVLTKDADADNDGYWHPVLILQLRLPGIFDRVTELANSPEEKAREIAATLLGQNGVPEKDRVLVKDCLDLLLVMLRREPSHFALESIVYALGHFHDPRSIEALVALASHPSSDIRYALVHSLCGDDGDRAIRTLIGLSTDLDHDVRNWATFGLGSLTERDTPEIRDALLARLGEASAEIRDEAMAGLARCGDSRVIGPFLHELNLTTAESRHERTQLWCAADFIAAYAIQTGDLQWLPALQRLKILGLGDATKVQAALDRYQPPHPSAVSPGRASESNATADVNVGQQPDSDHVP